MAEYQMTQDEYKRLVDRPPHPRAQWARGMFRVVIMVLALTAAAVTLYFRQWLFGAVAVGFVVFSVLVGRQLDRSSFERDPFKGGRVEVDVKPDTIDIRAGANQVTFVYADLADLLEYPRCFVILHHSGLQVRVPRSALTEREVSVLVGLQNVLPNIAKKMYVS